MPDDTPTTIPAEDTEAIVASLVLQAPPEVASESVAEPPGHTLVAPDIAPMVGAANT